MSSFVLTKAKRVAVWFLILLLCLVVQAALLEGVLRWWGVGQSTRFLLRKEVGGQVFYAPNRAFYQQFTSLPLDRIMTWDDLDFLVPAEKEPGTVRIFVFGSSAIYGTRTSSRILEVMLRDALPDINWEVYNAACPGMNSHVMRAAAQACRMLEPDLYLVYMGNNEAVGPFGPTTFLGRSGFFWRPAVIRTLIALNGLRITQLLRADNAMVALNLPDSDALMGMLPSMTDHYRALQYYERNLEALCAAAAQGGAETVLCTLAGNKRFMGVASPGEPDFQGLSINGIVRDLSGRVPGTYLADVNQAVGARSEDGLPGYEYFFDNVHFNFDGNYIAARTMLESVVQTLRLGEDSEDRAPLSRDDCAVRLAWTDAAEFEQLWWQMQTFQDDYTRARTRARYETLEERLGEQWREQLAADMNTALDYRPDDLYLRNACFRLHLELGKLDEAETHQRALLAHHPAARVSLRARAQVAERRGDPSAAEDAYRECLAVYPDDPEALKGLAELLFAQGGDREPYRLYGRYWRAVPFDPFVWCRLGQIEERLGKTRRAENTYQEVIRYFPNHPLAYRLLDDLLADRMSQEERESFWDAMSDANFQAAEPRVRRALLHAASGEDELALDRLRQAAQRAADDPMVQGLLGKAAYKTGAYAEAEEALRLAIRLQPGDGSHRMALMETLLALGREEEARQELEICTDLGMMMPPELRQRLGEP